ncbi:hypothetical protein ACM44_14100 [Chryseobacterium koreense CCUG 49689]|uniref:Uncharacterized protein n=1 Tax=Chryseobacterium koreense CCUG 49689 TaxID=1304281 RepID=A0A0J7LM11_9FLAO|nr:hypothetical protein ACM44_14100 [Chryseobacterium koreense CCUG 49689]
MFLFPYGSDFRFPLCGFFLFTEMFGGLLFLISVKELLNLRFLHSFSGFHRAVSISYNRSESWDTFSLCIFSGFGCSSFVSFQFFHGLLSKITSGLKFFAPVLEPCLNRVETFHLSVAGLCLCNFDLIVR